MLVLGEQEFAQLAFELGALLFQGLIFPALNLLLFDLVFEPFVGDRSVAGDLVNAPMLIEVFKVILLGPAIEHQVKDLRGSALTIIGQDTHLDGVSLRIGGLHDELTHLGILGPILVEEFEAVNPLVLRMVAGPFQRVLARTLRRVPGEGLEVLFPGDEVIVRCRQGFSEDLVAENAPVHNAGHHGLGGQAQRLAKARQQRGEALAHILVVIGALQIHRLAGGGVKEIRVQHFVGPADAGAPAFEHVLHPGVVFGVGIKVKVPLASRAHQLGVKGPAANSVNWLRWGKRLRSVRPRSWRRSSRSRSLVCSILTAPNSSVASHCLSSQPLAVTALSTPNNTALKSNTPR